MRTATRAPHPKGSLDWVKRGQAIRISMWQFPVPEIPIRAEDWFAAGNPFDSPEDLVAALQAMPIAGSVKPRRRFLGRIRGAQIDPEGRSHSRLRSIVLAALIVTLPFLASEVTSRSAVTADLNVRHGNGSAANLVAPKVANQPGNSGVNGAQAATVGSGTGNTGTTVSGAPTAQVAGVTSESSGTQPTETPPAGTASTPPAPTPTPPPPVNLLSNPSFESNGNEWSADGGTLYRCSNCGTAEDGQWVMEENSASSVGNLYGIIANPGYIATAGQVYTASIWVRAYNSYAYGQNVTVGLFEDNSSGTIVQVPNTSIKLSYTWQKVSVTLTAKNSGDKLLMYVCRNNTHAQESFVVDNAWLSAG